MRYYGIIHSFRLLNPNYVPSSGTQKEGEESRRLLRKVLHIVSLDQQPPVTMHT